MVSTYIVQFYPLFHLPLSDLRSDQYWLSCCWKPANLAENMVLFHSDFTNIGQITNLKAGGERAHETAQFTYWPYHNTIITQILNWSQRCRNRIFGTAGRFQPGQKPTVLCPVRVTTPPRQHWSGFWPGLEPNRTAGENPDRSRVTRTRC